MDSDIETWRRQRDEPPAPSTGADPWGDPGSTEDTSERTREFGAAAPPPPPPPAERLSPSRGGPSWFSLIAVALIAALVASGLTFGLVQASDGDRTSLAERVADGRDGPDEAAAQEVSGSDSLEPGSSITEVADAVLPSVARVDVEGQLGSGSGSAVVYSEDGLLITNNHVVEGAGDVQVQLADATRYDAEVVGTDPRSDLALLRIEADNLPVPAFATASPAPGDTAIAIGSPFGLDSTVTSGIVSATERPLQSERGPLVGLIQTDAAINPGNSGGALVNDQAEIIGINTAIFSRTGQNSGIGFAIPVDTVLSVAEDLATEGEVEYAYLGISPLDVNDAVAQRFGLETTTGALVAQVVPGGPADRAGVEVGDIIVAMGDLEVTEPADVFAAVRDYAPGEETTLRLLREGRELEVDVTLDRAPAVP